MVVRQDPQTRRPSRMALCRAIMTGLPTFLTLLISNNQEKSWEKFRGDLFSHLKNKIY